MKISLSILGITFALSLSTVSSWAAPSAPQLVPKPFKMTLGNGSFTITRNTTLLANTVDEKAEAYKFAVAIAPATGFTLPVKSWAKGSTIRFMLRPQPESGENGFRIKEGYRLLVTPQSANILAAYPAGLFYGAQTLRQLLPPSVYSATKQLGVSWSVPAVSIDDAPRFQWRGLHIDCGRHFFPVADIKKFIDVMATQKFNTLHWHLTEDQGWRLEIKKYPKLTQIGSVRAESPKRGARNQGDGTPYGGFYTQAEARDIVAYAAARHVTVVPEIEIPGHAAAAITAYPELGNTDVPGYKPHVYTIWGVHPYTFAPKPETFAFLEDVLTEVLDIFPSTYIHIGGDEAPTTQWEQSAYARDFMKQHNLKNGHQLQSYFNERLDTFLTKHGRKLIGWDEILEGGLSPNAAVMSWRGEGGARRAAALGHPFVMASNSAYYLDYAQGRGPGEPETIGGYVPLRRTYEFDPAAGIPADKQHLELGVQGQLWSEFIWDMPNMEYMAYPRACAVAETAWTPANLKDYADFRQRLETNVLRLKALGVNFRPLEVEQIPAGTWKSGGVGETWIAKEWDISPQITKAGNVEVTFQYTGGTHRLDINKAELLQNGAVIATDQHDGTTGGRTEGNIYRFALPNYVAGAKYSLRANVRSDGGNDSNGEIYVVVK
jgi:hexosaminidase